MRSHDAGRDAHIKGEQVYVILPKGFEKGFKNNTKKDS